MSLTDTRQALADALSAVDGVTGYTKPPTTLRPGDAWARFGGMVRDDAGPFRVTWVVTVLLVADEAAALDSLGDLVPALYAELQPLAYVESFTPVLYRPASGAEMPALEITINRE